MCYKESAVEKLIKHEQSFISAIVDISVMKWRKTN